jgi:cobalt-zinc-cadmium efflux system protein
MKPYLCLFNWCYSLIAFEYAFVPLTLQKMKRKLGFVFLLNLLIAVSETIGGVFSKSYSLLSDALHNFQDSLSQLFSLIALILSEKGRTSKYTFGFARFEILAALINATIVSVLSFLMIVSGFKRVFNPEVIKLSILLPVSIIGLFANLLSLSLLHSHSKESLNIKSTYLHLLGDALSSIGVIVGGFLMLFFKIFWVDGLMAILIGLLILKEGIQVVIESLRIMLQAAPFPVHEEEIFELLKDVPGLRGIHHVHIWSLKDGKIHLEAHLEVNDMYISETKEIVEKVNKLLQEKLNITHSTLQLESQACKDKSC